ncbi:phosphonate C-P lyase system protein PhnH [Tistrella mobilis]|jgi:alpha-D-ribose 1-methylphosphonate 5-triphosphate synthase subunit PhnH|uniref:phosphonate C-P lyase system protein PhnH n=1 Tax=Tistrella mobilis TaxID=171437 RepID=UPI00355722A9
MSLSPDMPAAAPLASLAPGFPDPVGDAQTTFRAVLDAMARPGRIARVTAVPGLDRPLSRAAAAVLLALADHDTPVWLDRVSAPALPYLRFHTGAPLAVAPDKAAFAVIGDPEAMPAPDRFALGTDAYPDRSTTLVIEVETLSTATAAGWRLEGPGIDGAAHLAVTGLPAGFVAARAALAPLYPRGLDIVLTAGDRLAALPRTTRITPEG